MKKLLIAALVLGFAAPLFAQAPQSSPVAKEATQKHNDKKADKAEKKAKRAEAAPAPEAAAPAAK
jgi:hypothetical protein